MGFKYFVNKPLSKMKNKSNLEILPYLFGYVNSGVKNKESVYKVGHNPTFNTKPCQILCFFV